MEKLLVNRKEAASLLSVSVQSIDKLVHRGELRCVRVGKRLLIPPEVLQEFTRKKTSAASPARQAVQQ
jgi:excisionase family DNA binding protein